MILTNFHRCTHLAMHTKDFPWVKCSQYVCSVQWPASISKIKLQTPKGTSSLKFQLGDGLFFVYNSLHAA